MNDMLRGYLQVAGGLTQVTRQKALEVARHIVAASPVSGVLPSSAEGADELSRRAMALADELVTAGRQNRAVLVDLVRTEVEAVVARLGLTADHQIKAQLEASRARVRVLEAELAASRASARKPAAKKTAARKTAARKTAAKKATAKKASPSTTARRAGSTTR